MIGTAASLHQKNGEAGILQPLVVTTEALAVQIGLAGRIERLAQKHRRRSFVLSVPDGNISALRSVPGRLRLLLVAVVLSSVYGGPISMVVAQVPAGKADEPQQPTMSVPTDLSPVLAQVSVHPVARDEQIRARLQRVLLATDSFTDPQVRVEDGVVFLHGKVESAELKKWAGDLARNTQDVVAVANQMEMIEPPVWDFRPAWSGLLILWRDFVRSLPTLGFGLLILALSVVGGMLATRGVRAFLLRRISASLLRAC